MGLCLLWCKSHAAPSAVPSDLSLIVLPLLSKTIHRTAPCTVSKRISMSQMMSINRRTGSWLTDCTIDNTLSPNLTDCITKADLLKWLKRQFPMVESPESSFEIKASIAFLHHSTRHGKRMRVTDTRTLLVDSLRCSVKMVVQSSTNGRRRRTRVSRAMSLTVYI